MNIDRLLRSDLVRALVAGLAAASWQTANAGCDVRSGPTTAALVELYTSEGCSSCPPADRQLSHLNQALGAGAAVVPLSLHVDYWDDLGWKDPYARAVFDRRQSELVRRSGHQTVYTPQFFVAGREVRGWQSGLADRVREENRRPARAALRIEAHPRGADGLDVRVTAVAALPSAQLYVAVTEDGLVSKVTRGENGGVTLSHDHVVRAFYGPVGFAAERSEIAREVVLAGLNSRNVGVAAFVADEASGEVLQAMAASGCAVP
jgi:hypothetical protein